MGERDADPSRRHHIDPGDSDAGQTPLAVVRGVGATLLLTDERLILMRDGAERRPTTGVQALPIAGIGQIAIELGTGPSGRIVVHDRTGRESFNIFVDARSVDRARALVDLARPMIARARRPGWGTGGPVPPDAADADSETGDAGRDDD